MSKTRTKKPPALKRDPEAMRAVARLVAALEDVRDACEEVEAAGKRGLRLESRLYFDDGTLTGGHEVKDDMPAFAAEAAGVCWAVDAALSFLTSESPIDGRDSALAYLAVPALDIDDAEDLLAGLPVPGVRAAS